MCSSDPEHTKQNVEVELDILGLTGKTTLVIEWLELLHIIGLVGFMHSSTTWGITALEWVTQHMSKLGKVGGHFLVTRHPSHGDHIIITKHNCSKELMDHLNTVVLLDAHEIMEAHLVGDPDVHCYLELMVQNLCRVFVSR